MPPPQIAKRELPDYPHRLELSRQEVMEALETLRLRTRADQR